VPECNEWHGGGEGEKGAPGGRRFVATHLWGEGERGMGGKGEKFGRADQDERPK